jgi:hypothetical protein
VQDTVKLLKSLPVGTVIPKPQAIGEFRIKGWVDSPDGEALTYVIPSHTDPFEKISTRRIRLAFRRLISTGELTRSWFKTTALKNTDEGGYNFTSVGGLFCLLGFAEYVVGSATYRRRTTTWS